MGELSIERHLLVINTRSTLQKERLTVHGFGNRISCAFVNAALPYKSVCKYCVYT